MRTFISALIALSLSTSAFAVFDRGNVLLKDRAQLSFNGYISYETWLHFGAPYALLAAWIPFFSKDVPIHDAGHFVMPSPDRVWFHTLHTMSFWDGAGHPENEPGKGYVDVFQDDAELGEILEMRSGNLLVAERPGPNARLIEFNLGGIVAEYPFSGAEHIELLFDQCTLLYTASESAVHRVNICTHQEEHDFAILLAGRNAGAIRQLPSGDVIVADEDAILEFNAEGSLVRSFEFRGVTHVALSTDGGSFWAAGVDLGKAILRKFDPATGSSTQLPLGNPESTSPWIPLDISDLVVIGEWRAATFGRHRRIAHH